LLIDWERKEEKGDEDSIAQGLLQSFEMTAKREQDLLYTCNTGHVQEKKRRREEEKKRRREEEKKRRREEEKKRRREKQRKRKREEIRKNEGGSTIEMTGEHVSKG